MSEGTQNIKRKKSTPSEGYICSICNTPGHWVQLCPDRKKKKTNPCHVYTPGVDPSEKDIETARELQKIKPPNCFCGISSRLKKVKRSHASDNSRAIGKYFFFCSKKKDDLTKCRFARPVESENTSKNQIICTFYAKRGFCMRGDRCMYKHEDNPNKKKKISNIPKEPDKVINEDDKNPSDSSSSDSSNDDKKSSDSSSNTDTSDQSSNHDDISDNDSSKDTDS